MCPFPRRPPPPCAAGASGQRETVEEEISYDPEVCVRIRIRTGVKHHQAFAILNNTVYTTKIEMFFAFFLFQNDVYFLFQK